MRFPLLLAALGLYLPSTISGDSCKLGDFDLTPISRWTWIERAKINEIATFFHINLCNSLGDLDFEDKVACGESAVCHRQNANDQDNFKNIGNFSTVQTNFLPDTNGGGFNVYMPGDYCPEFTTINETQYFGTKINFRCGVTLGAPVFIEFSGCTFYFDWYSTVACKGKARAISEVPCYIYDGSDNKRDLSPLIKQKGGYYVSSDTDSNVYINVCRDITPDGDTVDCPPGTSACKKSTKGDSAASMGSPDQPLGLTTNGMSITYLNDDAAATECLGYPASVTINFVCPKDMDSSKGSQDPVLISDLRCQLQVEWWTEHACPVNDHTSSDCTLSIPDQGIQIDLTPLTKKDKNSYRAESPDHVYFLNVCGNTGVEYCNDDSENEPNSVCQISTDEEESKAIAGTTKNQELRYGDGVLTLTYKGGDICHHNGFQRTSIITFQCNSSASDDGIGSPTFTTENECTYFFNWPTKYACVNTPELICGVSSAKSHFDLSVLTRSEDGKSWAALDGRHDHGDREDGNYYINVCDVASGCPPEAAACFVDHNSKSTNLGKYTSSPIQKEDVIEITYTDGDKCNENDDKFQTLITFICSPGNLESGPTLFRKSGCLYEFEWKTAAACPLGKKYGKDCKVFDDDSGFMFDLNNLKREDDYSVDIYKVATTTTASPKSGTQDSGYDFYLNVCADLRDTPCDGLLPHPAICQAKREAGGGAWVLGQVNTTLEYFDGVIRMKNFEGSPYKSGPKRKSEISFLCSPTSKDSNPQFVQESNGTYFFKWYTPYACPEPPIECTVIDETTHQQYDLSSLSKSEEEENWSVIDDNNPGKKKRFYLNVCRPINPVAGCAHFAGICQTEIAEGKEDVKVGSLGKPGSGPVVESVGNIMLSYTKGGKCTDSNGKETQYQTRIHFRCHRGALSSSPQLSEVVNNCEYVFLWETEAACPIEDTTGSNCQVKDLNSEYTFNLQVLNSLTGYEVSAGSRTFWINICGGFEKNGDRDCGTDDKAAFCEVKGSNKINVADVSDTPSFSDDGQLKLVYVSPKDDLSTGNAEVEVEITFRCRRNETIGEPVFVREEGGYKYLFDFETAVACLPQPVDCFISDMNGNQYDLSPLSSTTINWEAVDTRAKYEHLSYHINVCRPLNPNSGYNCPGGPIGACQTSSAGEVSHGMGYIQANPQAGLDGSLSIRYLGGDPCHGGRYFRSTRINFECSGREGSPVFQEETASCEYVFAWQTPSACPLSEVKGQKCTVKEPLYGYHFDLSPLHNSTNNYVVKDDAGQFEYELNVCGPLVNGPKGCGGDQVGACQKYGTKYANAGNFNQVLIHDNGVLKLNYTGGTGSCHKKFSRSSIITFHCDHSVKGTGSPTFIEEDSNCTYMFDWHTELACPSYKMVQCSYRGDHQYDLTPLAKLDDNYLVIADVNGEKQKIYLNLCRSVTHGPGVMCPYDAAACLVTEDESGKTKSTSLGTVSEGPSWSNDHLVIKYVSGDHCPEDQNQLLTSTINFQCSEHRVGGLPEFSSYYKCEYSFIWYTDMACKLNNEETITDDCTAINPLTGFKFDLSSLNSEQQGYKIIGATSNHEYWINICGRVRHSGCDALKVGNCQEVKDAEYPASDSAPPAPRHFNAGEFNQRLHFDDGVLFLNYSGGASCHGGQSTRNTIISFVCNEDGGESGEPVFVDESDDCTYYFSWHTPLACETHVKCSVANGTQLYDLSALIAKDVAYMAVPMAANQDPSLYYVNLCRPLNPIKDTNCPAGASICKNPGKHSPVSLGHVTTGPAIEGDHVTIKYINGSECADNQKLKYSSDITFHCLPGISMGVPQMVGYTSDDCTYHFSWSTYVVCPESKPEEVTRNCTYHDTTLDYTFDLSPLTTKSYETAHNEADKTFELRVCGKVDNVADKCKDSGACLKMAAPPGKTTQISIGSSDSSQQELSYQDGLLKLQYTHGDSCPHDQDQKRSTAILFECDDSCTPGSTLAECGLKFYYVQGNCMYTFNWKTSLACPPVNMPCHVQDGSHIYDLSPLSRITSSWQFTDTEKNDYWMNFCLPVIDRPRGCPEQSAICRKLSPETNGKAGQAQALGMTRTQTISVQELGGESVLVVEYQNGDEVCPGGRRAQTTIYFKCGSTVGGPLLTSVPLDGHAGCSFTVNWTSTVACNFERKEILANGNKITVPLSGDVIDLTQLTKKTYSVADDVRITSGDNSVDRYQYLINLGDDGLEQLGDPLCKGSAICQTKEDGSFYRSIGQPNQKHYYMQSDTLELVISEPGGCKKSDGDVNTTIIFICGDDLGNPEFSYESNNCQYVFEWHTSVVCLQPHVTNPTPIGLGIKEIEEAIKKHPKTAAAIVAVILGSITICILLIVFHRQDRRAACTRQVKSCFGSSGPDSKYQYSQLLHGEDTENTSLLFEDENEMTEEMADGSETAEREHEPAMINASSLMDNNDDTLLNIEQDKKKKNKAAKKVKKPVEKVKKPVERPQVKSYHDDSDEDILV